MFWACSSSVADSIEASSLNGDLPLASYMEWYVSIVVGVNFCRPHSPSPSSVDDE